MPNPKKPPAGPVTVRRLPVVTCALCEHPLPHEPGPGQAQAALTDHYNREHLTGVAEPSR